MTQRITSVGRDRDAVQPTQRSAPRHGGSPAAYVSRAIAMHSENAARLQTTCVAVYPPLHRRSRGFRQTASHRFIPLLPLGKHDHDQRLDSRKPMPSELAKGFAERQRDASGPHRVAADSPPQRPTRRVSRR